MACLAPSLLVVIIQQSTPQAFAMCWHEQRSTCLSKDYVEREEANDRHGRTDGKERKGQKQTSSKKARASIEVSSRATSRFVCEFKILVSAFFVPGFLPHTRY